jgi:hypothetical protein
MLTRGVCRYLQHLENPPGGQPVLTCKWADKSQTLCTNPACLAKAKKGAEAALQQRRPASVHAKLSEGRDLDQRPAWRECDCQLVMLAGFDE